MSIPIIMSMAGLKGMTIGSVVMLPFHTTVKRVTPPKHSITLQSWQHVETLSQILGSLHVCCSNIPGNNDDILAFRTPY